MSAYLQRKFKRLRVIEVIILSVKLFVPKNEFFTLVYEKLLSEGNSFKNSFLLGSRRILLFETLSVVTLLPRS